MPVRLRLGILTIFFVLAASRSASLAEDQTGASSTGQANPHEGHQMPGMEPKKEETPAHDHSQMAGHEGMNMPGMNHGNMNAAGMYLMNMASGTSMNPESWQMPMLMPRLGSWSLMLMGQAYLVETQQS